MSIRTHALGRRAFLSALGGAGALSLLPTLTKADGPSPKRLVIFSTPNNWVSRDRWLPSGSGDSFALGALPSMLEPLEPHKSKLLLLGDLHNKCYFRTETGENQSHSGVGHMLTGHRNIRWPDGTRESHFWGGGISVDQYIANNLGVDALNLGASHRSTNNSGGSRISYTAANSPVTPRHIPDEVYDYLFGAGLPVDEQAERARRRRAILRHSTGQLSNLRARYGQDHGLRIERHLDAIAQVERRLGEARSVCVAERPDPTNGFPSEMARQMDLITEALACGLTQVATLHTGSSGGSESSSSTINWAAVPEMGQPAVRLSRPQHLIAHEYDSSPSSQNTADRLAIESTYFRAFAYLLSRMDSVMEEDGTLLDNSIVVYMKGMAIQHRANPMLYIVAGGGGGQLRLGRYERHDGVPHNNLLVSMCRVMGQDVTTFGNPEFCTGDLLGVG